MQRLLWARSVSCAWVGETSSVTHAGLIVSMVTSLCVICVYD